MAGRNGDGQVSNNTSTFRSSEGESKPSMTAKKSSNCRKCEKLKSIFETYKTNMSILHQRAERAEALEDEVLKLQKETKDLRSRLESAHAEIHALKAGTASETEKGSAVQRTAPEVEIPSSRGGNARKTLPGMERSSDFLGSSSAPACSNIKQVSSKIAGGKAPGAARPQELERGELGSFPRVPPQANAQGLGSSDRAEVVSSTSRRESRLSSLFGERDTARESCGTQPTELVVSSKKGAARPLGESGSPRSREGVSEGEAERAVVKPAVKPSPLPLPRPMASGSGASGAFAAAQFSFLSAGQEDEEGREEGDASRDEISSGRRASSSSGGGKRQSGPSTSEKSCSQARKRARTAVEGESGVRGGSESGSQQGVRKRGPLPRGGGDHVDDGRGDGWEAEQEEVELYEEEAGDMDGLGWNETWRQGDSGIDRGCVGSGLDGHCRGLAMEYYRKVGAGTQGSVPLEAKELRSLLKMELRGEARMEGIVMAVLHGRSRQRDVGFLGSVVVDLVESIDSAHALPPSDPEVLSVVVEELEGVAEVLAAPSLPDLRPLGWGTETDHAVSRLSENVICFMDEVRRSSSSGKGSGAGGAESGSGGYFAMSFGSSRKKKKEAAKARAKARSSSGGISDGKGGSAFDAQVEAPMMWWWETDDEARTPWALSRILGLLLRRLGQLERAKSLVHAMFLRALSCPSSLLRFPLAFLEAFPACVAQPESSPHRPLASSLSRAPRGTGHDDKVAEGPGLGSGTAAKLLAPGLWRRALLTAFFPDGQIVAEEGGLALAAARLKELCSAGAGGGGNGGTGNNAVDGTSRREGTGRVDDRSAAGGEEGEVSQLEEEELVTSEAGRLAVAILGEVSALHAAPWTKRGAIAGFDPRPSPPRSAEWCPLCAGEGRTEQCDLGTDDALAAATRRFTSAKRWTPDSPDRLAVPRCRGELITVEVIRALQLLALGLKEPWRFWEGKRESQLEAVIGRAGACERLASLGCHALALCSGAGPFAVRHRKKLNGIDTRVSRTLCDVVEAEPAEVTEMGQLGTKFGQLSPGAKAQAASALLSLIIDRQGERAAEQERAVVSWTGRLGAGKRLRAPLPLFLAVESVLERPPAHMINLERRLDRWYAALGMARREGIWLHRHRAVDGLAKREPISDSKVALTWDTELNTIHDPDCPRNMTMPLSPTERACAASHADLWRRHSDGLLAPFMPSEHPDAVLILEDDADLCPGFVERAKATLTEAMAGKDSYKSKKKKYGADKNWDLIYFGHNLPKQIYDGIKNVKRVEKAAADGSNKGDAEGAAGGGEAGVPAPGVENGPPSPSMATALGIKIAPVTFAWCLHAYILTRAAARKLVKNLPVSAPTDIFVASLLSATDGRPPKLTARAVLPVLATSGGIDAPLGDVVSGGTRRAGAVDGVDVWAAVVEVSEAGQKSGESEAGNVLYRSQSPVSGMFESEFGQYDDT